MLIKLRSVCSIAENCCSIAENYSFIAYFIGAHQASQWLFKTKTWQVGPRIILIVRMSCLLAESYPPLWGMFRLSESNGKLVSLLPSKRNFAEGNWAGGEAFACVPTFRNGHSGEARRCERKVAVATTTLP